MYSPKPLPALRQWQCFLAVAETRNFRAAAEKLAMTQPPLTRQIQLLEQRIGTPLFVRNTHQVALTAKGEEVRQFVQPWLQQMQQFLNGLAEEAEEVRIGLTRHIDFAVSDRWQWLWHTSQLRLSHRLNSRQLLHALLKGELDLIVTGEQALAEAEVEWLPLCREPLLVALPASHHAAQAEQVTLQMLSDLPLNWFPRRDNPTWWDKCEAVFQHDVPGLTRIAEPEDSLVMLSAIARGESFALMPHSFCQLTRPGLVWRPLSDDLAARLHIDLFIALRVQPARSDIRQWAEKIIALLAVPGE